VAFLDSIALQTRDPVSEKWDAVVCEPVRLHPGTSVGPYEVLDFLGAGGMAEVYRALDPRLRRKVALKVVGARSFGDNELSERLQREARLAGGLSHPNIVAVYDVGEHGGAPYIVTELLEGETLRERLRRGPVPLSTALEWAIQIAQGLGAAHEQGLVHRDLKPENVFITSSGRIKLLDFGIAKPTRSEVAPGDFLQSTVGSDGELTGTGVVLGTPGYMSPEQLKGEPLGAPSDLFSLGAMLYELLSGTRAFPGATNVESSYRILHGEPAPLPPTVPQGLAALVRGCLEKDPVLRFQSARDLALSIEALRSGVFTPSGSQLLTSVQTGRRIGLIAGLASIAVLACAAAVLLWGVRRPVPRIADVHQLTHQRGSIWAARFAPDDRTVYLSAAWGGGLPHIYALSGSSAEPEDLGLGEAQLLAVSQRGELLITLHPDFVVDFDGPRGTLARVLPRHQLPRELATGVEYADWAPDGERIAVTRWENGRSRLEYPLGNLLLESTAGWISHPRVAPDGERVAFILHPVTHDNAGQLMVIRAGQQPERWTDLFADGMGPLAWAPDGESILFSGSRASGPGEPSSLWRVRRGRPPVVIHRETSDLLLGDVSHDGRVLVIGIEWRQEIEVQSAGLPRNRPVEGPGWELVEGLPRDGRSVLYLVQTDDGNQMLLRRLDAAVPIKLGVGVPLDLSQDGLWALASTSEPSGQLSVLPTGTGNSRTWTVPEVSRIRIGTFFPDGRRAAVLSPDRSTGERRIHIVNLENGESRVLRPTLPAQIHIAVSPDQRRIAAVGNDDVITMLPVEGGEPIRVAELGPAMLVAGWTDDGALVAFERRGLPSRVLRFDPASGSVRQIAVLSPNDPAGVVEIHHVRMTPDAKTFAFHFKRSSDRLFSLDWHGSPP
jgi:tRNA A-37 threonylcarbamoyl transferase component Bud32/dipeptidyl aminopeptidase/acylaminoacyl peptidase